jgi:glycosyltransferase involved in cell wall biosynthesis
MIKDKKIAVIIAAYNESGLITKTLRQVPDNVDLIIPVNDGSTDSTLEEMQRFALKDKRMVVIDKPNGGVGSAIKAGIPEAEKKKADYVVIAPGDNQSDFSLIKQFVETCEAKKIDVCRGNRFMHQETLTHMPKHRLFGNIVYSFISKVVSGYYSIFDFQSSYGAYRMEMISRIPLDSIRDDYLFENSLWVNLNIVDAVIVDYPIPSIYKDEVSDIDYLEFVAKSIPFFFQAFFHRIYQKYLLRTQTIGVFYLAGLALFLFGFFWGLYIIFQSIGPRTASTATVMLSIVPFILGFQLLLQAIVLDIQNEPA